MILNKKFAPTALEKSLIFSRIYKGSFPDLFNKLPDLPEKVKLATDFKLKPNFNIDEAKLWNSALHDILIVFEYYIEKMSGGYDVEHAINEILPYTYFKPFLEEKIGFNLWLNLKIRNTLKNFSSKNHKAIQLTTLQYVRCFQ